MSISAKQWFEDMLETYHDFPKNHTRSELRRACKAVSNELSSMPEHLRWHIFDLLEDHVLFEDWERKGRRYGHAAQLLLPKLEVDELGQDANA